MITEIGTEGLGNTYQLEFPESTPCVYCEGNADIAFTAMEEGGGEEEKYICEMYDNKPGGMWLHDAAAFATYLCRKCLKPTTLCNQA